MPRRSSGGRSSGGRTSGRRSSLFSSRPAAATKSQKSSAPAPVASAPPPAPMQAGSPMGGRIVAAVADGLAFGGGSAIAHRAVDAVAGPRTIRHETVASPASAPAPDSATMATGSSLGVSDACGIHMKAFQDCLNTYGSDISKCQFYMDMLSDCRKNSGAGLTA